ncbi:MAG: type I DNA topoisomerase [Deltaproteobacteria bacterium]|nr:MAG: type I DNA topoisomerase [Deltaproteobacteria bacterium]
MARSLLIVESPTKAKTLKRYVGTGFTVKASVGHVKDLPRSRLGVDVEHDFAPELVVIRGKKKVIEELRRSAKSARQVLLAPDPDREGEAIAWHIAEELKDVNPRIQRVVFNEITKAAVLAALESPREIDANLVAAQQARRVLDRLVGYEISPLLWDKVRRGLSAGRVQSVALRLVVERERQIEAFKPREYWTIEQQLRPAGSDGEPFQAQLEKISGKKAKIADGETAARIRSELLELEHRVARVERKERLRRPLPPFTTSTLQQAAASVLRFSAKKTMRVAQQLYEGIDVAGEGTVGLITYMRTDSTRLAGQALEQARRFISSAFGPDYLPGKPVQYRAKKGAQDAHEAIRPTNVELSPEKVRGSLSRDQARLYELIWRRFVACQMAPARYDQTGVDINAGNYLLRATGSVLKFPGFLAVAGNGEEQDGNQLPPLEPEGLLEVLEVETKQHFTQPPPRFSEGTLVKELEERGIGRPSTYASIIDTIVSKHYVERENGRLHPTDLGKMIADLLVESFPEIMDVDFTASMEKSLDEVEEGRRQWVALLREFYDGFSQTLARAKKNMRDVKREEIPTEHVCEKCGRPMVIKWGRNGHFLACSGYPECRNTKEIKSRQGNKVEIAEAEDSGQVCEKCGRPMVFKRGRFGRFLACSGYPECKNTKSITTGVTCPVCGEGELVERRSKRGRVFYGCNRYPQCRYSVFAPPLAEKCPLCGFGILVRRETKRDGVVLACPQKGCSYKRPLEQEPAAESAAS